MTWVSRYYVLLGIQVCNVVGFEITLFSSAEPPGVLLALFAVLSVLWTFVYVWALRKVGVEHATEGSVMLKRVFSCASGAADPGDGNQVAP